MTVSENNERGNVGTGCMLSGVAITVLQLAFSMLTNLRLLWYVQASEG